MVAAYDTLHDPQRRAAYDADRDRSAARPAAAASGRPVAVRVTHRSSGSGQGARAGSVRAGVVRASGTVRITGLLGDRRGVPGAAGWPLGTGPARADLRDLSSASGFLGWVFAWMRPGPRS